MTSLLRSDDSPVPTCARVRTCGIGAMVTAWVTTWASARGDVSATRSISFNHFVAARPSSYFFNCPIFRKNTYGLVCLFFVQSIFLHSIHAQQRVVRSLLEIRQQQVVIQQFDLSCGAAALATLLRYQYGDPVSEREIATGLMRRDDYLADPDLIRQRAGFSLLDLKRFVQSRGYQGAGYSGMQLDDLVQRAPLMVPINLHGYQHFVIFRGRIGNQVLLADPAWGNRAMRSDDFLRAWIENSESGGIGFMVLRHAQIDAFPQPKNHFAARADDLVLLK